MSTNGCFFLRDAPAVRTTYHIFSGNDDRRHPPPSGAQCLPFAAASLPPKPVGSLVRRPSTSKAQFSPVVLRRCPAVADRRSPSPSNAGVQWSPTTGHRRPGSYAFRRPSPPRMPQLSSASRPPGRLHSPREPPHPIRLLVGSRGSRMGKDENEENEGDSKETEDE